MYGSSASFPQKIRFARAVAGYLWLDRAHKVGVMALLAIELGFFRFVSTDRIFHFVLFVCVRAMLLLMRASLSTFLTR